MTAAYIALPILSNAAASITQKPCPARVGKEYTPFFDAATFGAALLCFFGAPFAGIALKIFHLHFKSILKAIDFPPQMAYNVIAAGAYFRAARSFERLCRLKIRKTKPTIQKLL